MKAFIGTVIVCLMVLTSSYADEAEPPKLVLPEPGPVIVPSVPAVPEVGMDEAIIDDTDEKSSEDQGNAGEEKDAGAAKDNERPVSGGGCGISPEQIEEMMKQYNII